MNLNLIVFNIAFYLVNFLLYQMAKQDPGSSLGIGFVALAFWVASAVLLMVFFTKKIIVIRTLADKLGVLTATPLLLLILISVARG